jgi:protein MAK16
VQAEVDKDYSILDQNEETQDEGCVSLDPRHGFLFLSTRCLTSASLVSPQLVPIKKKTEKREAAREAKALTAARLEKSLERELIARLKSRAYGDQPLNVNEEVWQAVLNREKEVEAEKELEELGMESDDETDSEEGEGEYEDGDEEGQFVSDFDESDVDDMEEYDEGEVSF